MTSKQSVLLQSASELGILRDWAAFTGEDFLKCDNNGNWTLNGAPPHLGPYLPLGYRHVYQRWHDGRVIETIDTDPLPDLDELNGAIPRAEWQLGHNGNPRPPVARTKQLILLDPKTAGQLIFSASSIRALIAVTKLVDRIKSMTYLRGGGATPLVELTTAPFNTQFGMQKRGEFKIVDWVVMSAGSAVSGAPAFKRLPEPSLAEELDDAIPFK